MRPVTFPAIVDEGSLSPRPLQYQPVLESLLLVHPRCSVSGTEVAGSLAAQV